MYAEMTEENNASEEMSDRNIESEGAAEEDKKKEQAGNNKTRTRKEKRTKRRTSCDVRKEIWEWKLYRNRWKSVKSWIENLADLCFKKEKANSPTFHKFYD